MQSLSECFMRPMCKPFRAYWTFLLLFKLFPRHSPSFASQAQPGPDYYTAASPMQNEKFLHAYLPSNKNSNDLHKSCAQLFFSNRKRVKEKERGQQKRAYLKWIEEKKLYHFKGFIFHSFAVPTAEIAQFSHAILQLHVFLSEAIWSVARKSGRFACMF